MVTKTQIDEEDIRKFILFGEYYRDEDARKTFPVDNNTGKILKDSEVYAYKHYIESSATDIAKLRLWLSLVIGANHSNRCSLDG